MCIIASSLWAPEAKTAAVPAIAVLLDSNRSMLVNAVTQLTLPQQRSFSFRPSHSMRGRTRRGPTRNESSRAAQIQEPPCPFGFDEQRHGATAGTVTLDPEQRLEPRHSWAVC